MYPTHNILRYTYNENTEYIYQSVIAHKVFFDASFPSMFNSSQINLPSSIQRTVSPQLSTKKQVFYLILFNFVIACPGYPSSNFLHIKFHIIQDPTLTKPKKILHTIFVPKEFGPK